MVSIPYATILLICILLVVLAIRIPRSQWLNSFAILLLVGFWMGATWYSPQEHEAPGAPRNGTGHVSSTVLPSHLSETMTRSSPFTDSSSLYDIARDTPASSLNQTMQSSPFVPSSGKIQSIFILYGPFSVTGQPTRVFSVEYRWSHAI